MKKFLKEALIFLVMIASVIWGLFLYNLAAHPVVFHDPYPDATPTIVLEEM